MASTTNGAVSDDTSTFYDRQELRNPAEREASMFHALPGLIQHAIDNASLHTERLRGIEPDSVNSRAALAGLPIMRAADLPRLQRLQPPFAGLTATAPRRLAGIILGADHTYHPAGTRTDYWRFARALYAAGIRSGEIVHNAFTYHLDGMGTMVETGARALGCPVIAAGDVDLEVQVEVVADLRPVAFAGPVERLLALAEAGRRLRRNLGSLRRGMVSDPSLADEPCRTAADLWGIETFRVYATPELGLIAYETAAHDGLVVDESMIVEIIEPVTGTPLPDGELGEVVVTAFNPDYPMIRLATGDLSAIMPGTSGCGRTNMRLKVPLARPGAPVQKTIASRASATAGLDPAPTLMTTGSHGSQAPPDGAAAIGDQRHRT